MGADIWETIGSPIQSESKIWGRAGKGREDHKGLCKPCETKKTLGQRRRAVTMGGGQGKGRVKFVIKELCGKWNGDRKGQGDVIIDVLEPKHWE